MRFQTAFRLLALGALALLVVPVAGARPAISAGPPPLFVRSDGSDSSPCTSAQPCRSFNRSYRVAVPGQTILIAGGRYAEQVIERDPRKKSSKVVVLAGMRGASVETGSLTVRARHLELRDLRVREWKVELADHVTFRRVVTTTFDVVSSTNIRILGGRAGPTANESNQVATTDSATKAASRNVLIDGMTIRGFHRTDGTSHVDCIHVWGTVGLTVRNSRISDCEHFAILATKSGATPTPTKILIENNFIDCCRSGYYAIYLGDGYGERWRDVVVRHNSTDKAIGIGPDSATERGVHVYSNVAPAFDGCGRPGVTVDYNVWSSGSRCGSHDRVGPSGFLNPRKLDFRLRPCAAAIDRGDPKRFPRRDIEGQRRPQGRAPDAGADEAPAAAGRGC